MNLRIASRIVRIGNSRGLILPMAMVKAMGFELGQEVKLEATERGLVIIVEEKRRA